MEITPVRLGDFLHLVDKEGNVQTTRIGSKPVWCNDFATIFESYSAVYLLPHESEERITLSNHLRYFSDFIVVWKGLFHIFFSDMVENNTLHILIYDGRLIEPLHELKYKIFCPYGWFVSEVDGRIFVNTSKCYEFFGPDKDIRELDEDEVPPNLDKHVVGPNVPDHLYTISVPVYRPGKIVWLLHDGRTYVERIFSWSIDKMNLDRDPREVQQILASMRKKDMNFILFLEVMSFRCVSFPE